MKKNVSVIGALLIVSLLFSNCEDSSNQFDQTTENLSLKESVASAALNLEEAVGIIEKSQAYEWLVDDQSNLKSDLLDDAPATKIILDDLKGVYEYAPTPKEGVKSFGYDGQKYTFFNRTGDSDYFVIQLPFEKVTHPRLLFKIEEGDDELENNFTMTTSDFLYESSKMFTNHKYKLATRFDKDGEYAGHLWVEEEKSNLFEVHHTSRFGFEEEYFLNVKMDFADTLLLQYSLEDDEDNILYKEKIIYAIAAEVEHLNQRFSYELQVGTVRVVQKLDEEFNIVYEIYKDGELQENAVVEVVVNEGEVETSLNCMFVNKRKDLQIIFDDESTVILSELIGDSCETLVGLFDSMKELYFAKCVINQLAYKLYIEQKMEEEEL